MERWTGRVAVVTGASMGIGAAIVRELANQGMTTIGLARNTYKIQEITKSLHNDSGKVVAIKCDVSKEEELLEMFKQVTEEYGSVDVCINNSGLGFNAPIIEGKSEQWRHMWEVNVIAPAICTQEAIKSMKQKGVDDGHIIYINSSRGPSGLSSAASGQFYSVSRHAAKSLTDQIRTELREMKSHIRVTTISPGLVENDSAKRGKEVVQVNGKYKCLNPRDVADAVLSVLSTPPHVQTREKQRL